MSQPTTPARRPRYLRLGALLTATLLALVGCSTDDVDATQPLEAPASDVGERAERTAAQLEAAGLGTLASAVRQVDLDEVVDTEEFTFFGPDDEAFQGLTADELADLTSDSQRVVAMLREHAVDEVITADELVEMSEVTTVAGTTLDVAVDGDTVTVGDATVLQTVQLDGGAVVHVTDVLLARE